MRIAVILVIFLGVFFRIYDLNNRPLHNDEGVNYHFLREIEAKGYYPYSHENYHGPLYFYLTNFFFNHQVEGVRDVYELRASAVLIGVLTLCLPFFIFPFPTAAVCAGLLAVSSSLVFYSRYAIHETLFAFTGGLFALAIFCYFNSGRVRFGYLAALALALMIGTKETFIITLFAISVATLIQFGPRNIYTRLLVDRGALFWGGVLAWSVIFLEFTGGFVWISGLREMILAVPQWISRNESDYGHFKPFPYYFETMLTAEPLVLFSLTVCLLSLIIPNLRRQLIDRREPILFLTIWALLISLIYSFVKYKTPWLIINLTVPALLALAWWIVRLPGEYKKWASAVACFFSVVYTARFVFFLPYGPGNPYSYTHTSAGMVEFSDKLAKYWERKPSAMVLIAAKQYWPIPFYIRGHEGSVHYVVSDDIKSYSQRYDVLVMDKSVVQDLPGFTHYYSRFSDVQECEIYFKDI